MRLELRTTFCCIRVMKWLRVLVLAPVWFPLLGHADNKTVAHTEVVLLGTGMPRPDPRAVPPTSAGAGAAG